MKKQLEKVIEQTTTKNQSMYDQECKELISHPEILSRILQRFSSDLKDESVESIQHMLESKTVHDSDLSILHEGKMVSDLFMELPVPGHKQEVLYLNVEAQSQYNPRI